MDRKLLDVHDLCETANGKAVISLPPLSCELSNKTSPSLPPHVNGEPKDTTRSEREERLVRVA